MWFSIVQRKVNKPANFTNLTMLEQRLLNFEARYNATASPFNGPPSPTFPKFA